MPPSFRDFDGGEVEFIGRRKAREPVAKLFSTRGVARREQSSLMIITSLFQQRGGRDFRGEKRGEGVDPFDVEENPGGGRPDPGEAAKHPGTSWVEVRLSLDANEWKPRSEERCSATMEDTTRGETWEIVETKRWIVFGIEENCWKWFKRGLEEVVSGRSKEWSK